MRINTGLNLQAQGGSHKFETFPGSISLTQEKVPWKLGLLLRGRGTGELGPLPLEASDAEVGWVKNLPLCSKVVSKMLRNIM